MDEGGHTIWRVRQIYWYEELPPEARLPEKSATTADRAQEPAIRRAVEEFIRAWVADDFARVDARVFHWWEVERKEPRWVKMTGVDLKEPVSHLGGMRLDFTAKVKLIGVLSKKVDGNLWLVQEDGVWRVRPLTVVFWF
jgi:hypothetical protein